MTIRDERGSVTPLIIGFFLILAVLVAVVVDASAAYLQKSGLNTVADGAALAGTEALDLAAGYRDGFGDPRLSQTLVEGAIRDYLHETAACDRYEGLTWRAEVTGNQVTVRVAAPMHLPLGVPGLGRSTTISTTGSAVLDPGVPTGIP